MKKFLLILLSLCMILSLCACGGSESGSEGDKAVQNDASGGNQFMAGFGVVNITPDGSVSMAGYGDHNTRFNDGYVALLEARCVAIIDENGDKLLMMTGDISFAYPAVGSQLLQKIEKKLGIPADHVILSGTHTHNSVATWMNSMPSVVSFNTDYINGMLEAAEAALEDCKPARVYVGSAITENLNFVRRYIMDDGSLIGDGAYGTGTTIVRHETDADPEMQMLKFVREGGKDILIANFQAHPHLEGKLSALSPDTPGAFRDYMEKTKDIYCMYWNGAAGNINSSSRIEGETRTKDRIEYGKLLGDYAIAAYDSMTEVKTGPIKVVSTVFVGKVNHSEHSKIADAQKVVSYFDETNDSTATAQYAWQFDINTVHHAKRIIANGKLGETSELNLTAFSFGDVSGITAEYEMFDTNGMYIKENTPFEKTFIVGYAYPGVQGYVPSAEGYKNGGYEADNSTFEPGTGELLADAYLELLNQLK